MTRHVYDIRERASHERVAAQLHALADQIASGRLEMSYDDLAQPVELSDPIELVLDLVQHRHDAEMTISMRWTTPVVVS